jgi:hypothetical protein
MSHWSAALPLSGPPSTSFFSLGSTLSKMTWFPRRIVACSSTLAMLRFAFAQRCSTSM